jgi:hypothetical protein
MENNWGETGDEGLAAFPLAMPLWLPGPSLILVWFIV